MSPRSAEQNEAIREQTRARIVTHALRLFAQHGYAATSVRMIAESAGMAQGLLYRYFESKEALLQALFEESMRDVLASFREADAEEEPAARLEQLVRSALGGVARNRDFWRLSYGVRMQQAVVEGLGDRLREWMGVIHRTLERYLREAGSPHPAVDAALLFGLIDGVCQHYVLAPERYPLDAVAEAVVERFVRPVCPPVRPSRAPKGKVKR